MFDRLELSRDHPGFSDPEYRARRERIAAVGAAYRPGQPIPDVAYTGEEDEVWRIVSSELAVKHYSRACRAYLAAEARLDLPCERIPQLRELDERVHGLTGFHLRPVPGLVPTRQFYAALADRTFLSTQYVRHHSVPFYTPEPDLVHETIGHANMLASDSLADLYAEAGAASRRTSSPDALEFFSRVFWFTIEFGVVWECGDLKAYGAGLLSSYGELDVFRQADIRDWDILAMGTRDYDITHYQPVLFAARSYERLIRDLGDFFRSYDEGWFRSHVGASQAWGRHPRRRRGRSPAA
jgi:phenylalanine-4-hydroxylase